MMGRDQTPSRWGTAFPLPEENKAQSRMKDAMSPGRGQFLHSLVFEVRYAPRLCKQRLSIPPTVRATAHRREDPRWTESLLG